MLLNKKKYKETFTNNNNSAIKQRHKPQQFNTHDSRQTGTNCAIENYSYDAISTRETRQQNKQWVFRPVESNKPGRRSLYMYKIMKGQSQIC